MYSPEQIEEKFSLVLSEIERGKSVVSILEDGNTITSRKEFYRWLDEDETKRHRYARACEIRAEKIFEEIIEIADDASQDAIYTERGPVENKEFVNRSRLKVDARKWVLSKMNPTKYGDKTILSGDKENPIEIITGMEIK